MKRFKLADIWISVVLIAIFTILSIVNQDMNYVFAGYFTVGGWQLISMITHFASNWFMEKRSRRVIYHWVVVGLIAIALLGWAIPIILFGLLFGLLFISPLLAIYYTWICYDELYVKMQRPIELLK